MIASLLLTVVLAQGHFQPEEAKALFAEANAAYENARYDEAMETWQKLVRHGYGGPDVLYNLGTAALKKGDIGQAVLFLERARRAGGTGEDLQANLEAARARVVDEVVGETQAPFVQRIAAATDRDTFALGFLVAWLAGFAFIFLCRYLPSGRKAVPAILATLMLLASVPLGLVTAAHVYVEETLHEGVVLANTLQARELPGGQSKVSFEVHAGLKVRLLETEGRFTRIRLPNGVVGWVQSEGLAEI